MRAIVADLFQRFGKLPWGSEAVLRVAKAQAAGNASSSSWPTVLIHGQYRGADEPLAVVLMAAPNYAADDQALLDFAARRSRAHKAPYFVTWTLRDAMLWKTPKPGTPATRDSIEKLRDYSDLYEIAASDRDPLDELNRLKVLQRGDTILHDLVSLLKDEALELVQIDATYFVNRLLDAVHTLLPRVSDSLHDRLRNDVGFRNGLNHLARFCTTDIGEMEGIRKLGIPFGR